MKRLLIYLTVFFCCVFSCKPGYGQFHFITDLGYTPQNITENDTIIIHYSYTFSSYPCTRDSIRISSPNDTCIILDAYYTVGDQDTPCNGMDSISPGLIFNLFGFIYINLEDSDSDTLFLTVKGTGTDLNNRTINQIGLFPNPAGNKLFFKGIQDASYLSIRNLLGGEVLFYKKVSGEQAVDISGLMPGLYVVTVYDRTLRMIFNDKLVIQ